jgi:nicotinate-nucleotide adenylyltransferase
MPKPKIARITPLSVPRTARGVLLFGGTFDPPHRAHVDLAASVRDRLCGRGWWLVYVPAARNPLKAHAPVATDAQRIAMLRLATRAVPRCAIWTDEIDHARAKKPSYWIDTLRRAREALPTPIELRFLIGSDQAESFHQWKDPREILAIAPPIVMLRADSKHSRAKRGRASSKTTIERSIVHVIRALKSLNVWSPSEIEMWESSIDDAALMPHAATDVRRSLAEGDDEQARTLVGRSVLAFARKHAIYGRAH